MMGSLVRWGLLFAMIAATAQGCRNTEQAPLKEIQRVHSGALDLVVLSPTGALRQGKDSFVLEFRDSGGQLADVGAVIVNATMPMAGMAPMLGESTVNPTSTKGRYEVATNLNMAGSWRLTVEWNGPAGRGSASLPGTVL